MTKNASNHILMIRPARFEMNEHTAVDNFYQQKYAASDWESDNRNAQLEFDNFVRKLESVGVKVYVIQDSENPHTPDSIFPNNWISMHSDGRIVLYPMKAKNRRSERISDIESVLRGFGFEVNTTLDFSQAEEQDVYLEGTGSIVFDHDNSTAYMARSQRADEFLLAEVCQELNYKSVVFNAFQDTPEGRQSIYHTNVMMCMTNTYAVICLEAIDDIDERRLLVQSISECGKDIIDISEVQKHRFAGNMLLVKGADQKLFVAMSTSSYEALTKTQIQRMEQDHNLVHSDLTTIETLGGGSARCMLAEIYLATQTKS
jgi:hypothetical protein